MKTKALPQNTNLSIFHFPITSPFRGGRGGVDSDHIGSSSFITDALGFTTQHLQYLPFGETFVEQQSGAAYNTPYKFSGKEKDEETGYSYFGARYYMPEILNTWLSVDPMADKYPNISPFAYCNWNPVMLMDPDGQFPISTHKLLVRNAIAGLNLSNSSKNAMLYGTGIRADVVHMSVNSVHMDNLDGFGAVSAGYNAAGNAFSNAMSNGKFADAGEAMHTIADFYAHSNYLDIYKKYCDETGKTIDPENVPTFGEAMQIPELKEKLNGIYTDKYKDPISDKLSNDPKSHNKSNVDKNKGKGAEPYSGTTTYNEAAKRVTQKDLSNRAKEQQKSQSVDSNNQ